MLKIFDLKLSEMKNSLDTLCNFTLIFRGFYKLIMIKNLYHQ